MPNLCPVPIWHCIMTPPPSHDGMAYAAYANDIFQIFGGFSNMHSLDNLGSFTGAFELEDLNFLIGMFLLGFLGQVRRKAFTKITLATYRKRANTFLMVFLTNSPNTWSVSVNRITVVDIQVLSSPLPFPVDKILLLIEAFLLHVIGLFTE